MRLFIPTIYLICGIDFSFWRTGDSYLCERQLNNCSCVTNVGGWVIDLSPLDKEAHGESAFSVSGYSPDIIFK